MAGYDPFSQFAPLGKPELRGPGRELPDAQPDSLQERRTQREMQAQGMDVASSNAAATPGSVGETTQTFARIFSDSLEKVNTAQVQADTAIKEMVAGRNKNIHETMLAIERADTSLKLMMQVRNKILDAYREIMRMQV